MAQSLQWRRHQEPAQLSRLAARSRSLGRPSHAAELDQRRNRQWPISTSIAISAKMRREFGNCEAVSAAAKHFTRRVRNKDRVVLFPRKRKSSAPRDTCVASALDVAIKSTKRVDARFFAGM